jgi:nucleoside-diphosphate-sugar epimerase
VKTALVTGSTGFVGLNLIGELLENRWRVFALHRPTSDLTYLSRFRVERLTADITDPESLMRAVPTELDAVFHVAANTNMWAARNAQQTRDNVDGTRSVVRAARERGAKRLIHTSSIAAFALHDEPIDESTPSNARESWINYLRTKALAEDEVQAGIRDGLDAVILNPANIVGPFDLSNWSTMIYLVHAGKLPGAPPGRGSFCHVREVVRAHIAAVDRGRTGENYLLGGADASYHEMILTIGRITSRPVPAKTTPAPLLRIGARVGAWLARLFGKRPKLTPEMAALSSGNLVCKSDKAMRELGYRETPLDAMLEDCHRWMVEEGRLR